MQCLVYRSPRQDGLYLYVCREEDLARVPAPLLARFGKPQRALELELTPQRRLARCAAVEVMEALERQGFFVQMPPGEERQVRGSGFEIQG